MSESSAANSLQIIEAGVGSLSIIVGTTAATMLIPFNVYQPGGLFYPCVVFAIGMFVPVVARMKHDAFSLMRGEHILFGAILYWVLLDILQGSYAIEVSRDAVVQEFLMLGIAALGFWLGATLGKPLAPRLLLQEAFRPWSDTTIFRLTLLAFSLGIWDFIYRANFDLAAILQSFSNSRWDSPWQREQLGDWSAFSYHLQYFGYMVPALTVLMFTKRGISHPMTIASVLMSIMILSCHIQGGGRRIVGAMILSGLFCWIIRVRYLTFKRVVIALLVIIALLAFMQLMLMFRNIGFGDGANALAYYDRLFIDDNFLRVAQMLEVVPESYSFVGWQYIIFAIVRPIPRVLWPDKPVDAGFDLAEVLGVPGTSFALTSMGELYVSFGYIGVFVGCWVHGRLATMANSLLATRSEPVNPLFPSLTLVWLFVGVRSMLEVMLMGYVLLAAILLSRAMGAIENNLGALRSLRRAT